MTPNDRLYAKTHEWVLIEGTTATVGITDHAQHELTDVVFVELPKVGRKLKQGEAAAVIRAGWKITSPVWYLAQSLSVIRPSASMRANKRVPGNGVRMWNCAASMRQRVMKSQVRRKTEASSPSSPKMKLPMIVMPAAWMRPTASA